MTTQKLLSLHQTRRGKPADKWSSYFDSYDRLLRKLAIEKITMLEVGIDRGGSLELWATYFINAQLIVGCDIDADCANYRFDDDRIKVVIGNITDPSTINKISELSMEYSLIIDDGSHNYRDVIDSFIRLFPLLEPGGIYIVEDTHCSYLSNDRWQGGLLNELAPHNFFKKLSDIVNVQFWAQDVSLASYMGSFFPNGNLPSIISDGWIEGIEFRNSLISIEKSRMPGHQKLGSRIISGQGGDLGGDTEKI